MARPSDPRRDHRWAWVFVVLIPVGAVLAQVIGYGIAMLLGYDVPEAAQPPLGAALVISLPPLVVAVTAGLGALFFGIRAGIGGRVGGYLAAIIGGLAVVYWVVVTTLALIGSA